MTALGVVPVEVPLRHDAGRQMHRVVPMARIKVRCVQFRLASLRILCDQQVNHGNGIRRPAAMPRKHDVI